MPQAILFKKWWYKNYKVPYPQPYFPYFSTSAAQFVTGNFGAIFLAVAVIGTFQYTNIGGDNRI